MKIARVAAALSAILALISGCTTVGHPVTAPDPATLDVGPYSRTPLLPPSQTSEYHGRVLESVRMAEIVVDPAEVDPALVRQLLTGSVPLPTPVKATVLLADPVRTVLEKHGMLAGVAVASTDSYEDVAIGNDRRLYVIVLRFPDPPAAQRAAQEIDAVDAAVSSDNVAVTIPGHPTAHGHWRPTIPSVAATLAQDSFVISIFAGHSSLDIDALTSLAGRALDVQLPLLRDFVPTPADRLTELGPDPDGMLARMVPDAPGRWPVPVVAIGDRAEDAWEEGLIYALGIVYGPRGAKHHPAGHVIEQAESLGLNRFDRLWRLADAAIAQKVFAELKPFEDRLPLPAPAGLVDINCDELNIDEPAVRFSCTLRHGRYIARVYSRDYRDVQQRAAAQYALLVNSE